MAKRTGSDTSTHQAKVKKKCGSFKMEWLSEYVQIEEQAVKLSEMLLTVVLSVLRELVCLLRHMKN